jgi:hypothetical protein
MPTSSTLLQFVLLQFVAVCSFSKVDHVVAKQAGV